MMKQSRSTGPSRSNRWQWSFALLLLWPLGCGPGAARIDIEEAPRVRVRLLQAQEQVMVSTSASPLVQASSEPNPRRLHFPQDQAVPVVLSAEGWRVGNVTFGPGELVFTPSEAGSVRINGLAYRGLYRLVPVAADRFDVVNDVDVDSYLKGVLARELLPDWHDETYRAQAIVARTYALYEARMIGSNRHWDLNPDQRSQVYGGMEAESARSRQAVRATAGVVLAYGSPGRERIFKTYYSSCCGGVTQSASDAFGEAYMEPLSDQDVGSLCSASPRFNWGPVVVDKQELTRRFRLFGARRNSESIASMATVSRIEVQKYNRYGRPTRFTITDADGQRYSWGGEEIRWAVNTDASEGSLLFSSFFKIMDDPDKVHFVEGRGWGHAVGMCQWCAQRRAESGMRHEDIVLAAYQRAVLVRGY